MWIGRPLQIIVLPNFQRNFTIREAKGLDVKVAYMGIAANVTYMGNNETLTCTSTGHVSVTVQV